VSAAESWGRPVALGVAVVVAAGLLVGGLRLAGSFETLLGLTTHDVEDIVQRWGAWGVAASVLLMVLHSFMPVPAEIIAVANGMCFGSASGAAVTWLGAMLGAAFAFALARGAGRPLVRRAVSEARLARLDRWCGRAGTLLLLRLVPVISFNLINYAAGLAGVPWWTFLWTTALGILPLTIVTAVLGARMLEVPVTAWAALGAAIITAWLVAGWWRRRR
jgi:uncharacterized membrane protein YdjX (TVP38/TMEM64 family)